MDRGAAEQAFGRGGIAQGRQQEVDRGTRGIDGPVEVTPTALNSDICLINAPGFVGRLKMTPQSLFQFGTVSLHPMPDRRVVRLQVALGEQLFDIAQRQRVSEIPAHGTKNQLRRRLPPLEDCRPVACFTVFSAYQPPLPKLQHIPLVRYRGNDYSVPTAYGHREVLVRG